MDDWSIFSLFVEGPDVRSERKQVQINIYLIIYLSNR